MSQEAFPDEREFLFDVLIRIAYCSKYELKFYLVFEQELSDSQLRYQIKVATSLPSHINEESETPFDIPTLTWEAWENIKCPYCRWHKWPPVIQCRQCDVIMCGYYPKKHASPKYQCRDCDNHGGVTDTIKKLKAMRKTSKTGSK